MEFEFHVGISYIIVAVHDQKDPLLLKINHMKTQNILLSALFIISVLFQSCSDDYTKVTGKGAIVEKYLDVDAFTELEISGVDDVHIEYGTEQSVRVEGHENIIELVQTKVMGNTWYAELEEGNYGRYELTYYLTLPTIESIGNTGTGDVFIDSEMTVESIDIYLSGTGSYYGFSLAANEYDVSITGTGSAELTANEKLNVKIEGTGSVYYKGHPDIEQVVSGTGKLVNAN